MKKWYVVYRFGYSDTDSTIVECEYKPDIHDVADMLDMDADKIKLIKEHK